MNSTHTALIILVTAAVTILLRFLPFIIFSGSRRTPGWVSYLGRVLPCAIMGMLVVFCLKDVLLTEAPFSFAELIACAVTAGLHLWKRNTLVSIAGGTVCCMLLTQFFF